MLYGNLGPVYWGRCQIHSHKGRRVYTWWNHYNTGVCVFGYFLEWNR